MVADRVEDESADPVGDGHSDAEYAERVKAATAPPGRPNPEPDTPVPAVPDDAADDEADDAGEADRRPGKHAPGGPAALHSVAVPSSARIAAEFTVRLEA